MNNKEIKLLILVLTWSAAVSYLWYNQGKRAADRWWKHQLNEEVVTWKIVPPPCKVSFLDIYGNETPAKQGPSVVPKHAKRFTTYEEKLTVVIPHFVGSTLADPPTDK